MFSFIKQVFILLLSFNESLVTNCVSLNDEPCKDKPAVIDLNTIELKYDPFMIILNKCHGSYYVLFPKIYVLNKNKRHKC